MLSGVDAAGRVRVEVLGAVRAWLTERELALGTPRQRAVLAALALRANQLVTRDQLIDAVWGQEPPAAAANVVHTYVARLRRALDPGRTGRSRGGVLSSAGPGYVLRLKAGQLDAEVFDEHLTRARQLQAHGDPAGAAESFDAALAMWHDVPLAGIPGPFAEVERTRLTEQYLTAAEDRAEAMLASGHPTLAVAQVTRLVAEYPFRERLTGLLMLGLVRSGRQAEALAAYRRARRLLVHELGVEPGQDLQRLHDDILHHRDTVAVGRPDARGPGLVVGTPVAPRQLPPAVRHFTGRQAELKARRSMK